VNSSSWFVAGGDTDGASRSCERMANVFHRGKNHIDEREIMACVTTGLMNRWRRRSGTVNCGQVSSKSR